MIKNNNFDTALKWFPSILVAVFFTQNAFEKILQPHETAKLGLANTSVVFVGILILIATVLFLMNRTVIIGTVILASYMTVVVLVHINKGKPFLLTALIALATIFAGFSRKTKCFDLK